jgi:isoleucyl-tRNA synthetase
MRIMAWTTTPWTLPSNLALAVGPDVSYSLRQAADGTVSVLGVEAVERYAAQLEGTTEVGTLLGSDLVGRSFTPMFDFFADRTDAFRILGADFVGASEGTGVVHMAPGFGEDDQTTCEAAGIPIGQVVPVDGLGRFTDQVGPWAGLNVFDANPEIIRHLKEAGRVVRHDTYEHNYPHCWRTDTPIIYKAISSWFVKVTDIRDRLMETNQEINWVPSHVRDGRFGMWLDGARDWSISRNRFWGSPIPVWRSDDPTYPRIDVYGSLDEIERDFGIRPDDLHRPFIDELTRPNPDDPTGRSTMRRVPEVLDCWFESGSMPFAQVHYPFENREWFEEHFPADFIVEYINQTRGWFYTLHVLATALFDRPAFENVICHGILLAEDGTKLSKKLRNYTEPSVIFDNQGSDALRWYLMSSTIVRGGDLRISDSGIDDVVRQVLLPTWNAYGFFTLYANVDGHRATMRSDSGHLLDRYLLAKTSMLVEAVADHMDAYDLPGATQEIQGFIDALNNWYIRRSRDRFWSKSTVTDDADKRDAYDTLYTVLVTFCRVAAPLLPMVSEEIHTALTGGSSVHLADWPDTGDLPSDPTLVARMDRLRDVASTTLRLREDHGLRVRLPLSSLIVAGADSESLADLVDLLVDEVNVKSVVLTDDLADHARFVMRPDGSALGPRLGGDVQAVFGAARSGSYELHEDGTATVAGHLLQPDEFTLGVESPEGVTAAALGSGDAVVVLDTEVTEDLSREGLARDVVRQVQQARRDADLVVTDRIRLVLDGDDALLDAVRVHEDHVAGQVLATELVYEPVDGDSDGAVVATVEGAELRFRLSVT